MQTQPTKNESKPTEPTKTIVVNKREAMVIGQLPHRGNDKTGRVILGETVPLLPGVNLVDTAKLRTLRENKLFDAHFSTEIRPEIGQIQPVNVGAFVLIQGAEVPSDTGALAKMDSQAAAKIISETFDSRLLDKWLKDDGRDGVRAAIHSQKKLISGKS